MDVIGVIPARYSSSRFAGKVLADIMGKPMLQHVWERAKQSRMLDDLIIACDNELILKAAAGFGAKAVMTSKEHTCGTDRISEVVNPLDVKIIINIQADEPLIHPMMIDSLARTLLEDKMLNMATLMKKIDDVLELLDPNVVKVVVDKNNFALYFSRAPIPYLAPNAEIDQVTYYKHIGLYVYRREQLMRFTFLKPSDLEQIEKLEQLRFLEHGMKMKIVVTEYDSFSVDTPKDLEIARRYYDKHLKK